MTSNSPSQAKKSLFTNLTEKLRNLPKPQTEESVLLRILVQLLVIVGIIATDVAAAGNMIWFGLPISVLAVPLSILGGIWSWQNRQKPNVGAKFLIAIGMLGMLLLFFQNLVIALNDTRLVLAELLIQLQILHSFDLPRRKDLGYSMVIGLILLGVAGTVSQTLTFAPWLVLFLAIALPVLMLDYRSRLGLEGLETLLWPRRSSSRKRQENIWQYSPLSPKRLGIILSITLVLGMGLFLAMPRFPGYQLSSLPVGLPTDTPENERFSPTNRTLFNPGYESPTGEEGDATFGDSTGTGQGSGSSPTEGAGEIDKTQYYGFNNIVNQNLRGEMERRLVMRVRSQAPGFWRVMSFDKYTGQGWEVTNGDDLRITERSRWAGRFFLTPFMPNGIEKKRIIQSYTATMSLPNIVPAMQYPLELYFPTAEIGQDPEGNLRSPLGLLEGLTYTAISQVPYRDRTALAAAGSDYPEIIRRKYLEIPPEIEADVRAVAEDILSRSNSPITSPYEKALFLAQGLKQRFPQPQEIPFFEEGEDLVEAFLFKHQGGYPDHYATVLTVMLRSLGIPARFVTGFGQGDFNPFTGYYLVHNTDAHALTEAYFPGQGWFAFDPRPGQEVVPPSFEESGTFGVLRWFWDWVASWVPSPIAAFLEGLWFTILKALGSLIARVWSFVSGGLVGAIIGAIALGVASMGGWFIFKQIRQWYQRQQFARLPIMEQLYQQMLALLQNKGHKKQRSQTPWEFLRGIQGQYRPEAQAILAELTDAYVGWRYGNQAANTDYLREQLRHLQRSLSRGSFKTERGGFEPPTESPQ
ncbi:DUF3488 and DUF4129 domain-containing transglutaminase family protein [Picosynechococcus sp. NKBG15041c]|uniref:transglutaminase TgpA family protein n=1 Tax=Picosynechococcus sp. NKBG15041c TaxID=1407650 RepID=UPI000687DB1C|nr:DUF3488 and DUF4129 domain-containing transglutaminase family protein [Picosynechococcus sp. NKBG15041c]